MRPELAETFACGSRENPLLYFPAAKMLRKVEEGRGRRNLAFQVDRL
jgi:hypothetical protein